MSKQDKELLASFAGKYQSDIRWIKASNKALRAFPRSPAQEKFQDEARAIQAEYAKKSVRHTVKALAKQGENNWAKWDAENPKR